MLEMKLFYFIYFIFNLELKENKKNLKKKKNLQGSKNWWRNNKKVIFLFFFLFFFNSVLPLILSVDIGAILDQELCNFDPAVEWRVVVVVPSVHQRPIFLQKLPNSSSVVLVRMLENRRGLAHSHFLLLLQRRWHWCGASAVAAFAVGVVSAGLSFPFPLTP